MPTPKSSTPPKSSSSAPAEGGGFAFAGEVRFGADTRRMILQPQDAWTWMVNPGRLTCRRGRVVPQLVKATWRPGSGGNDARTYEQGQRGEGAVLALQRLGWVPVPHSLPGQVAFGAPRVPSDVAVSAYMDRLVSADGSIRFVDAWSRPVQVGDQILWERDEEGFDRFLQACLELVHPQGVTDRLADIAAAPILRNLRRLMEREDKRGLRMARDLAAALPPARLPEDVQAFLRPSPSVEASGV